MDYDEAAAERLEAVYLGPDVVAQRRDTLSRLELKPGETVLDIGSGPGFLADEMADCVGTRGRVTGIDISDQMVVRANRRNTKDSVTYAQGDATALPFPERSFDVVVSTQVAEYVADIDAFCAEAFRVTRSGGRGLILATDWDTMCWHSSDPDRMQRVLRAFAPHCADSKLPRTLVPRLRKAGFELKNVSLYPIINLDWYPGCYSETVIPFIVAFVSDKGTVPANELKAWADDLAALNQRREHFFSTNRFIFEVQRLSS